MNFILKWLNGALGETGQFEETPEDQHEFPDEGIVLAPDILQSDEVSVGGLYLGPKCQSLVQVGARVVGGQPLAEIHTSTHILEVVSPCNGVVVEIFVENGQVVESEQPLIRLEKP